MGAGVNVENRLCLRFRLLRFGVCKRGGRQTVIMFSLDFGIVTLYEEGMDHHKPEQVHVCSDFDAAQHI